VEPKSEFSQGSPPTLPAGVVLLVDDEPSIREVSEALLESEGYRVVCAVDGSDALAILRGGLRPCIIILDLMMPVMDGWEFRRQQLGDRELLKIPTIVYSAVGGIDEAVEALNVAGGFEKGDFDEMLRFVAQFCLPKRSSAREN
jgi:CheY-like chemotaxis protein